MTGVITQCVRTIQMAFASKHVDGAGGRADLVGPRGRNAMQHRALRPVGAAAARKVDARDGLALRAAGGW